MHRRFYPISICLMVSIVPASIIAQDRGTARVDQVRSGAAQQRPSIRVAPVDVSRSSASEQQPVLGKGVEPLTPAQLGACRDARERGRPAPDGAACVAAPAAAARRTTPTAEVSLLGMLGASLDTGVGPTSEAESADADQVARQLSTGTFQGSVISDAAASVARDRAATPPPPPQPR